MIAFSSINHFYWAFVLATAVIFAIAEKPVNDDAFDDLVPKDTIVNNQFNGTEDECLTLNCNSGVCNFLDPFHPCECEPGFGGVFCDQMCEYLQTGSDCQLWPLNTPVCMDKSCLTKGIIDDREYIESTNSIEYTIVWTLEDGQESTDIVPVSEILVGSRTLDNYAWYYHNNGCEPVGCQNGGYCVYGLQDPYNFTHNNFTRQDNDDDSIRSWTVNFQCICPSTFAGEFCERLAPCDLPCENGVCEILGSSQRCNCETNFFGDLCQDECSLDCQHGGICIAYENETTSVLEQTCLCNVTHDGELCENERVCRKQCQNGGPCRFEGNWWMKEGIDERDLDFLIGDVLKCFSGGYTECKEFQVHEYCDCPPTARGEWCETTCDLDCNGGTCEFLYGVTKRCSCPDGFTGDYCQYECTLDCKNNGRCYANATSEWCECGYLHEGPLCEQERICDLQCKNGATCQFQELKYTEEEYLDICLGEDREKCPDAEFLKYCTCSGDWAGRDCSQRCPCENGGTCRDINWFRQRRLDEDPYEDDSFIRCDCPFGTYGALCQEQTLAGECNLECKHGECVFGDAGFNQSFPVSNFTEGAKDRPPFGFRDRFCICKDGYSGPFCEVEGTGCSLECQNGVCISGEVKVQGGHVRLLEDTGVIHDDYCQCNEGYSGDLCERKSCGSGYCSNAATCIELPAGQQTAAGDDYVCDCSTSSFNEIIATGRHCETTATAYCSKPNDGPNEPFFCSNFGRCNGMDTCLCSDAFFGPRCEYSVFLEDDLSWGQCRLECKENGICLKGYVKPVAEIFFPFLEATAKSQLFNYSATADFEYCHCPIGFFGVQCENQYELCGIGEHICFHGSKCTKSGDEWGCDCTGTESAGLYCMHKATNDCDDNDPETFCTNDSTCALDSNSNAVCTCPEGWEGTKCETELKVAAPAAGGDDSWSSAAICRIFVPKVLALSVLCLASI